MIRNIFLVGLISGIPILGALEGMEVLNHPLLQAGGMGILGWLLWYQMRNHNDTVKSVASEHKEGLVVLSQEMKGFREDMREDAIESRRILTQALRLNDPDHMGS